MSDLLRPADAALERLKSLHPQLIDLSLDRIERLLDDLGRPQDRLPPVIHIAGTNGKGSTLAVLRSIAQSAGLSVHALTSPHLVRFAERIRLAGTLIGDAALADALRRVEAVNDGRPITFFEITTAVALLAFSETPADLCLIEVGLGGRFDATNVFDRPALSVITPVDYDHQEFLGSDLGKIAWEKAGVIKSGRPVVMARQKADAEAVIVSQAEALTAPVIACGQDFDAFMQGGRMAYQSSDRLIDLPPPGLFGPHQVDNAGVAVAAALALGHPSIDDHALARGVAEAVWPARMQRLTAGPFADRAAAAGSDLWLDGGHNPHGAAALVAAAKALQRRDGRPLTFIIGLLKRKDAGGIFRALVGLDVRIIVTGFSADAASGPADLARAAADVGLRVETSDTVEGALDRALQPDRAPHVIIWGSLYLAGDVLARSELTWPR